MESFPFVLNPHSSSASSLCVEAVDAKKGDLASPSLHSSFSPSVLPAAAAESRGVEDLGVLLIVCLLKR